MERLPHVHVRMFACMYVCMYDVCMYVCMYVRTDLLKCSYVLD